MSVAEILNTKINHFVSIMQVIPNNNKAASLNYFELYSVFPLFVTKIEN